MFIAIDNNINIFSKKFFSAIDFPYIFIHNINGGLNEF